MTIEDAITHALRGIEVKDVQHGGRHRFNIHPVRVQRGSDGSAKATGQISHQLRLRKDDQVRYEILKRPGQPAMLVGFSIDKGGLGRMLGIDEDIADLIGTEIDGSWEGAARDIAVRIAARL
jgi:hypothetical protein